MDVNNLLDVHSRKEFRLWLEENHDSQQECWVEVKRGRPQDDGQTFWYIDAVEEALCFGWIDATTKTLPDGRHIQRFCHRRPKSNWTELNKERCRRMIRLGKMTDAGTAVLPDMSEGSFVIDRQILKALKKDKQLWENFQQLPDLYKRIRIDTIQFNKDRRPELFKSRLQKFIENTRQGKLYGEWNDNGRLLV